MRNQSKFFYRFFSLIIVIVILLSLFGNTFADDPFFSNNTTTILTGSEYLLEGMGSYGDIQSFENGKEVTFYIIK